MSTSHRWWARPSATVALITCVVALATPASPALAQGVGAPSVSGNLRRPAATDFASTAFGDPWDFEEDTEVQTDYPIRFGPENLRSESGLLRFDMATTGHLHLLWPGFAGALTVGREGLNTPVDASRFTVASFRIRIDAGVVGNVGWETCPGCHGHANFGLEPGWQTVVMDLRALSAGQTPWAGDVSALRLSIGVTEPHQVDLDWFRLSEAAPGVDVTWANPVPGSESRLYWDGDDDPDNNTADSPRWGFVGQSSEVLGTATFPAGAYPAGTYRFYAEGPTGRTPMSSPLVLDEPPLTVIDDPDITGGEDYATARFGDPWDFSQPSDVAQLGNVAAVEWSGGQLHGTNAPPEQNDPYVVLRTDGLVDTNRYHRLTVRTTYDGPFDLADAAGGGAHGRWTWRQPDSTLWQQTAELVTYTDVDTYTVDLHSNPRSAVMETDLGPQPGWGTAPATLLRYDLNEDRGTRRWRIDDIRLAADDEARGSFTIRWHDDAAVPGTTVTFVADTDRTGHDGTPIAADVAQQPGSNQLVWNTRDVAPGTYWVAAVARNGTATTQTYASGPVVVLPHDGSAPPPSGDAPAEPSPLPAPMPEPAPETEEPDGVRVAGPDRVATGVALSRTAFPDGAPAAVLARAADFPDALAAAPLAAAAGGPLLLNPSDALSPAVEQELARLGAGRVYLMGGSTAQSPAVEAQLLAAGHDVVRLAGADRYATASAAAVEAVRLWRESGDRRAGERAILALGTSFPDALAAGPLAAYAARPLLLLAPGSVPAATQDALADLGVERAHVVGGSVAIPQAVVDALSAIGVRTERLAGASRYDTAVVAAQAAVEAGATGRRVVVASGEQFPDALAAGPAAVGLGGILLLTPPTAAAAPTLDFLAGVDGVEVLHVAGGRAAVTSAAVAELAEAAGLH